jgi:hypothetical protein
MIYQMLHDDLADLYHVRRVQAGPHGPVCVYVGSFDTRAEAFGRGLFLATRDRVAFRCDS